MFRKFFLFVFLFILLAVGISAWQIFGSSVSVSEEKFFYIKTGESFNEMKEELKTKKIIKGDFWFTKTASLLKFNTARAGKYELQEGMNLYQLIRMLKNGKQTPVNLVITKLRLKEDLAHRMARILSLILHKPYNFFPILIL